MVGTRRTGATKLFNSYAQPLVFVFRTLPATAKSIDSPLHPRPPSRGGALKVRRDSSKTCATLQKHVSPRYRGRFIYPCLGITTIYCRMCTKDVIILLRGNNIVNVKFLNTYLYDYRTTYEPANAIVRFLRFIFRFYSRPSDVTITIYTCILFS